MSVARPWLYTGTVMHRRLRPAVHSFRYRVFFLRFPLSRLQELQGPLFSLNRFNLLSFHQADHGDGGDPLAWIHGLLARHGVDDAGGEVVLQTFPRVLGYVFNPVSFWFCHAADGGLRAVVAEVNNTFGERHCYLLEAPGVRIANGALLGARKVFHVSPFCAVEGGYRFRFGTTGAGAHPEVQSGSQPGSQLGSQPTARCVARIDYADAEGDLLHTSMSGQAQTFSSAALAHVFLTHPLLTVGIVLRIHWQAARLWLKRVPFYRKPAPPAQPVTR